MAVNNLNPATVPPTAAEIATAVAAPSSATIATAVAAAVPTTAGITTIVQANAGSPYAGSWTYLGTVNGNTTSAVTFTGLSSYKYLKAQWVGIGCSTGADLAFRINSDTGNNYSFSSLISGSNTNAYGSSESVVSWATIGGSIGVSGAGATVGNVEFTQSNSSTALKLFDFKGAYFISGTGTYYTQGSGMWSGTAAISSLTFLPTSGTFSVATTRGFFLFGGN